MLKNILILIAVVFMAGCRKDKTPKYEGIVKGPYGGCNVALYLVSYSLQGVSKTDTLLANNFPDEFKNPGTRIAFNISKKDNFSIFCTMEKSYPPVKELTNIRLK